MIENINDDIGKSLLKKNGIILNGTSINVEGYDIVITCSEDIVITEGKDQPAGRDSTGGEA